MIAAAVVVGHIQVLKDILNLAEGQRKNRMRMPAIEMRVRASAVREKVTTWISDS